MYCTYLERASLFFVDGAEFDPDYFISIPLTMTNLLFVAQMLCETNDIVITERLDDVRT